MMTVADHTADAPLVVGDVVLDRGAMTLSGAGGTVHLRRPVFRVSERLMRRPGVIVPYPAPPAPAERTSAHGEPRSGGTAT